MLPSCSTAKEEEPVNECSVCRGEIVDETNLDACTHTFCFNCICEWCRKGPGPTCPMCKAVISNLTHNLDKKKPTVVDISEVRPTVQPALVEQANLQTEKRVITQKCRQCRRSMRALDERIERHSETRSDKKESLSETKRNVVAQLNTLRMLKDSIVNGSTKEFITSTVEFRRLIYTEKLRMAFPDTRRKKPEDIVESSNELRTPVIDFILNELKAIPAAVESERNLVFTSISETLSGKNRQVAERIFTVLTQVDMKNIRFARKIREIVTIPKEYLEIFIRELSTFINSGRSFLSFCGAATYSLPNESRYQIEDRMRRDVVTLSDGDDDDEIDVEMENYDVGNRLGRNGNLTFFPRAPNSAPHYNLRNDFMHHFMGAPANAIRSMLGSSVLSLSPFSTVFSRPAPLEVNVRPPNASVSNRNESNYVRDNGTSSESDSDSGLYARNPLRMEGPSQPISAPRTSPTNISRWPRIPSPVSWEDLIEESAKSRKDGPDQIEVIKVKNGGATAGNSDKDDDIVVLSDGDEQEDRTHEEKKNSTIVLDDTVIDAQGPSTSSSTKRSELERQLRQKLLNKKYETKKRECLADMEARREMEEQKAEERKRKFMEQSGISSDLVEALQKVADDFGLEGHSGRTKMRSAIQVLGMQKTPSPKKDQSVWVEVQRSESDDMSIHLVDEVSGDDDDDFGRQEEKQQNGNDEKMETNELSATEGTSSDAIEEIDGIGMETNGEPKEDESSRASTSERKRRRTGYISSS